MTVFAASCEALETACALTGVADSGRIAWRRSVGPAAIGWRPNFGGLRTQLLLPRTVLVAQEPEVGARSGPLLVVDPASGRTILERQLPARRVVTNLSVSDRTVLIISRGPGGYQGEAIDRGRTLWAKALKEANHRIAAPTMIKRYRERAYFLADERIWTLNLRTGAARDLGRVGEPSAVDPADNLGAEVVVTRHGTRIEVHDADTGKRLWTRDGVTRADIGDGMLLTTETRLPSPFLSRSSPSGDGRHKDWPRRLTLVDPRTGRSVANVVDRCGGAPDRMVDFTGTRSATISHRTWCSSYRISAD